jgi:CheY-like chemotaxis protein
MSKGTVLVIEDNPDILEAVRLLLEQAGFNVLTAEECFTGINRLESGQPDVILTDIGLPEMSGLEFIRLVRKGNNYNHIPIVAMSGYDKAFLVTAVIAGADAAVHKPEGLDGLTATIQQVIANSAKKTAVH